MAQKLLYLNTKSYIMKKNLLLLFCVAGLFSYGQNPLKLLEKKKTNKAFKIEQREEPVHDTTNNNVYQIKMEEELKPTIFPFEELEARHKKGSPVDHELSDFLDQNPNHLKALELYAQVSVSHKSFSAIDRAIELAPDNLNYRKIRARKLMNTGASEQDLFLAIEDLKFVNANGGEHHKTYAAIGKCYKTISEKNRRHDKPMHIELDAFGDNVAYNNAQIEIYEDRIALLKMARENYIKARDLGSEPGYINTVALPHIAHYIAELEQRIIEQPNKN